MAAGANEEVKNNKLAKPVLVFVPNLSLRLIILFCHCVSVQATHGGETDDKKPLLPR